MASTNFVDKVTVIPTAWCNEVDNLVHAVFNNPTTDKISLAANGDLTIGPVASPALFLDVSAYHLQLGKNISTEQVTLELGRNRTGNGNCVIDLIGDATYIDYGLRLRRYDTGPNASSVLFHRGTGSLILRAEDAGTIRLETAAITALKVEANQDVTIGTTCALFVVSANQLQIGRNLTTGNANIDIGAGRTGNGSSFLDFIGDATYTDYGLRIIRTNSGANTDSNILHRGTGNINITAQEAGSILLKTNNTTALTVSSIQDIAIGTTCAFFDVSANTLQLGKGLTTQTATLEIGTGRTGNGASSIVLVGDATYSDYGAALTRLGTGPNTDTILRHRGTGALRLQTEDVGSIEFLVNAFTALIVDAAQNIKIGATATMGTSATKTLGIDIGVEPTTSPAGMIQVYAKDSSDGTTNATLAFRTEQAVETIGTFTPTHKHKIWLNGVEYWIQLDAV